MEKIYEFANTMNIDDVKELLDNQMKYNIDIAEEGLKGSYGVGIGKVILEAGNSLTNKVKSLYSSSF